MDSNLLVVSFFFGVIGMGFFMYGKKSGRLVPLSAGVGLMAIPYFVSNLILLTVVGLALAVTPYFLRHQ